MKIFRDVFTNDEIGSDSYPLKEVECMLEIEGKMVSKSTGGDFNIGANDLEGQSETYENEVVRVINFVDGLRLQQTAFDKKSYMTYIKGYMKKLKDWLAQNKPERVADFQTQAQNMVKNILNKFDDFRFYTGENMDPEGMVALLFYKEDGVTPYLYIWKDGVIEEKV